MAGYITILQVRFILEKAERKIIFEVCHHHPTSFWDQENFSKGYERFMWPGMTKDVHETGVRGVGNGGGLIFKLLILKKMKVVYLNCPKTHLLQQSM